MTAAATNEIARPLAIGQFSVDTPVVLAPMAGVTNAAFRRLCREFGAGYYVSQLVMAAALLQRSPESMRLIRFDDDEQPRSLQLYGVDPTVMGRAAKMIVDENLADHIDLNFGCPVPKVTKKGGGAALPWKLPLFTSIVRAVVSEARQGSIPVTVKMRIGIDDEHHTYLDAARAAEAEGVAAIALHARTADQLYSGTAAWDAIAQLKQTIRAVPVLGNGDIWVAEDALAMMSATNCDGVVVGRGCLGRPWLFADLQAAFSGSAERVKPSLGDVANVMRRHAQLLVEHFGDETSACRDFRKHVGWYLKGYTAGRQLRTNLVQVTTLPELDDLLNQLDTEEPYPGEQAEGVRGRQGHRKNVALPYGWLDSQNVSAETHRVMVDAELHHSGG